MNTDETPQSEASPGPEAHALAVTRTARYYTLGAEDTKPQEVWFVLHGYGQLAQYFIRHFEGVAGPQRLVVAPEALSRFYLRGTGLGGSEADGARRIGASWMTSADRLREMDDYVAYLDALHDDVAARWPLGAAAVRVLGFSQGVATACRWAARGRAAAPDHLTCWAGEIPPELDPADLTGRLTLVAGTADKYVTPERIAAQRSRLDEAGVAYDFLSFDGDHRLDADVLRRLASS